jgi:1,4-alpha-glucan branching enzyme
MIGMCVSDENIMVDRGIALHKLIRLITLTTAGSGYLNFHPTRSYDNYSFEVLPGKYRMIFESDAFEYGGHGRLLADQYHLTLPDTSCGRERHLLSLYLPTRTAIVLQCVER